MRNEKALRPSATVKAREKIYSYMHDVLDMTTKEIEISYRYGAVRFKHMYEPLTSKIEDIKKSLKASEPNPDLRVMMENQYFAVVKNMREYHKKHLLAMSEYFDDAKLTRAEVFVGVYHLCSIDLVRLKERKESNPSS